MNDIINAILKRRSIRAYTDKEISEDTMNTILKAAMYAPTARNSQEWRFIVVRNPENLQKIQQVQPYNTLLEQANAAVIVCALVESDAAKRYFQQDCGASIQNLMLAAYGLGVGSVWLGVYPNEQLVDGITKSFKLPKDVFPIGVVALGYPAEEKPDPERFDASKIHNEQWYQEKLI